MSISLDRLEELKKYLCDRFTAYELIEILDIPVEEIVEIFIDQILDNSELLDALH